MNLVTTPNFDAPDDFYEALIDAHRELSTPQSHELNAKLVLLLANHVGRDAGGARCRAQQRAAAFRHSVLSPSRGPS
jgi:Protein of unknown function (DUF2783)